MIAADRPADPIPGACAPVVVVGIGGSGTRVVARLLQSAGVWLGGRLNRSQDALALYNLAERWTGPGARALQSGAPIDDQEAFRAALLEAVGELRGGLPDTGGPWGWKQPRSIHLLSGFAAVFPSLRVVHLVRDGRDVAFGKTIHLELAGDAVLGASQDAGEPVPVRMMHLWARANLAAMRFGSERLGDRYLVVRFEELCADAPGVARRILDFALHAGAPAPDPAVVGEIAPPASSGRWRVQSAELVDRVAAAGAEALQRFGYVERQRAAPGAWRRSAAGRHAAEPPQCPDGWSLGPPDFVGVGAQRSGTTWWLDLLTTHPDVVGPLAGIKELHYFERFHVEPFGTAEIDAYAEHFPRPPGAIVGEWTPRYMADPVSPQLLARAAPDAKLLVLLRDPIERYLSGLRRHVRSARAAATPLRGAAPIDAFARGLYATQLDWLTAAVARERILVLQYERCTLDTAGELARTFAFLGVDPGAVMWVPEHHPNRLRLDLDLPATARDALVRAYAGEVARLAERWPEIDLSLWPNFAGLGG